MKAVVVGVNYYTGLSALRSLGRAGVHVVAADYDRKAYGLRSKYCAEHLMLPPLSGDPKRLVDTLIDFAKKQDEKPLLFPTHDSYVHIVDEYFDELKAHFVFPQVTKGLFTACCDKRLTADLCRRYGVRIPPSVALDAPDLLETVKDQIGYPCIIKPDDSTSFVRRFGCKVFIVADHSELEEKRTLMREAGLGGQVQRIIKGFDDHMYTYDAYVGQDGAVSHALTCQKKRQWPINFGASTFIVQKHVPELHKIGAAFLEAIGWRGFAEIEFKKEEGTNDFYLIEINTRTTNFNSMIDACGINMPYVCYRDMKGEPVPPLIMEEDLGQAFCYQYDDFFAKRAYLRTGQLTRKEIKQQEKGVRVTEALFAKDDLRPWFSFWSERAGRLVKKILRIDRKS